MKFVKCFICLIGYGLDCAFNWFHAYQDRQKREEVVFTGMDTSEYEPHRPPRLTIRANFNAFDSFGLPLAGLEPCEICPVNMASYNADFITPAGEYTSKFVCATCCNALREEHPHALIVPLLVQDAI